MKFSRKHLIAAALVLALGLPLGLSHLNIGGGGRAIAAAPDLKQAAQDQIAAAEKALAAAKKAEAGKFAKDELKQAQDLLDEAKKLFGQGDYEKAELIALSAQVQAELAADRAEFRKNAPREAEEMDAGGRGLMYKTAPMAPPSPYAVPAGAAPPSPVPSSSSVPSTGGTRPVNNQAYDAVFFENYGVNPFIDTDDDHLSTFAVDVDTGSYTVTRKYLLDGNLPDKDSVRVEEFVNYFKYGYPQPDRAAFTIAMEGAPSKFGGENYKLVRIGLQGKEVKVEDRKDAVLTFVIDVSGSMDMENRLGLVKKSLRVLIDQLGERDMVGIVVYGTNGRVLMEHKGLKDKREILKAIEMLVPEGATNAAEGIYMGYQAAAQAFKPGAINRIILCSDGVANVGETGSDEILKQIKRYADKGITLTTIGFGMGNYNDVLMEKLADSGDGSYYYVDSLDEAKRVFIENLTGTLQLIAKDMKVQVDFNPAVVSRYRLLGYENRDVADEDFRNDQVDAGEVGAGHQVTALYEIKLQKDVKEGTVATVTIRYKNPDREARVTEQTGKLEVKDLRKSFDDGSADFRLAAAVAEFSEILRKSYWAKEGNLDDVMSVLQGLPAETRSKADVIELTNLVSKAQKLTKEKEANK